MAETMKKGVIVEFDFAAMDGAGLLFNVTKNLLANVDNIPFDERLEARHLAGGNYQGGLAEYFSVVKTKKMPAKAAKDLAVAFVNALNESVPNALTPSFRNFVSAIASKGVHVVISTRADLEKVRPAFEPLLGENVSLYQETSQTYGSVKWDAWRRACAMNHLRNFSTIAVTGSGLGVKSALVAGMGSVAVLMPHVAYQDFGGADEVVKELNSAAARTVLEVLRVD